MSLTARRLLQARANARTAASHRQRMHWACKCRELSRYLLDTQT
jgi:hypothetical protein